MARDGIETRTTKDGRKRYFARVATTLKGSGQQVRRSKTFGTKREATAWIREQQVERDRGNLRATSKTTLHDFADYFMRLRDGTRAEATLKRETNVIRNHIQTDDIARLRLDTLTVQHVQQFYLRLRGKDFGRAGDSGDRTRVLAHVVLRKMLDTAVAEGRMASNPARYVTRPKSTGPVDYTSKAWTLEDVGKMLDAAKGMGPNVHAFFQVAFTTGARQGELRALNVCSVDTTKATVRIGQAKTAAGRGRVVPLPEATMAALTPLLDGRPPDAPLFVGLRGGKRLGEHGVGIMLRQVTTAAGVPRRTMHSTRHSFCVHHLRAGTPVQDVAALVGHSSPAITLGFYARALPGDLDLNRQRTAAIFDQPATWPTTRTRI